MEEEQKRSAVLNVRFSRDGSKLGATRESGQIEMWTVSSGECQWSTQINLHVNSGTCLAFSADESKLTCKEGDKTIVLDAESGDSDETFDFKSTNDHVHNGYVS